MPDPMTPEEALAALKGTSRYPEGHEIAGELHSPEEAHMEADTVLLRLLLFYGQHEVVEAYDAIEPKWYA